MKHLAYMNSLVRCGCSRRIENKVKMKNGVFCL